MSDTTPTFVPMSRRTGKITAPRRDRRRTVPDETGWSKPVWWRVLALFVVVAAFLAPRISELDRLVTPDEPIWLARSANFYEALSSAELGDTYQFAHPGVTVMWLGAAGYWWKANDYADRIDGQIPQRLNRVALTLEEMGYDPLDIMVGGRIMIVLALTIVFGIAFLFGLKLLPFWVAVFGFLIMALDPFPLALSRLLHIDATATMFMLLSVLAGSVYLFRGRQRLALLASGIAAGLAVLTRSQMGVLAIWFAVMLLIEARHWQVAGGGWTASIRSCIHPLFIWGGASFLTFVLLWPAVWVDPIGTFRGMLDFAETAAIEGHERTVVFAGQLYEGDPGFRFYPTTFFWRATPAVIPGVILAVVAVVWARRMGAPRIERRVAISLMLAAASYGLLMSFAAKKFDRYLVPVYPLMALLAAWGLLIAARKIATRTPGPAWAPTAVAMALTLIIQTHGVVATAPYHLSYYNPVLGGAVNAPGSMMVGWGEGLDQIGAFINELPEGSIVVAAGEAWPASLGYFLDGDSKIAAFVDNPTGIYRWSRSDYYVLYITPLTRGDVWQPWLEELATREPLLTVTLNGLDYARLYDIRDDPPAEFMEEGRTGMVLWDGLGRMVTSTRVTALVPGSHLQVSLYFDHLQHDDLTALAEAYSVRLMLVDAEGAIAAEVTQPLQLQRPVRHGQFEAPFDLEVPDQTPLGEYTLEMELLSMDTGMPVQGFSFRYGDRLAATIVLNALHILPSIEDVESLADEEG